MFYFNFSTTILSTCNFYFCRAQTNDRIVVTDISVVSVDSIFAPLTASGTIVVDNVLASSYADVPHFIGQFALAPVRLAMSFFGAEQQRTVSVSTAPVPIFSSN
jgi:hypothetical protein